VPVAATSATGRSVVQAAKGTRASMTGSPIPTTSRPGPEHPEEFGAYLVQIGHEVHGVNRDRAVDTTVFERQLGKRAFGQSEPARVDLPDLP
jgi:hypothetical protein